MKEITVTTPAGEEVTIQLTPEYWVQPGATRYSYVNKKTRRVVNVDSIDEEKGVLLWCINAWGATSQWYCPLDQFAECWEQIADQRSIYEKMAAAAGRGTE